MHFKGRTAFLGILILLCSFLLALRSLKNSRFFGPSSEKQSVIVPTRVDCGYYDCLDVYRCGSRERSMLLHIPTVLPSQGHHGLSNEFIQILKTVKESKYYTSFPEKACFTLLPVDTLIDDPSFGKQLAEYPQWDLGTNVLVFNVLPGAYPDFRPTLETPIGKALLIGSGLSSLHYRPGFDVSFPTLPRFYFNISQIVKEAHKRKSLLLLAQIDIRHRFKPIIRDLFFSHPEEFVQWKACISSGAVDYSIRCKEEETSRYGELLGREAVFCLILPGTRLAQPGLMEAIASGCIPVIAIDSLVLPFAEVLDWKLFSVQIYEREIPSIINILQMISKDKVHKMRSQCAYVYESYFSSVELMTKTSLQILNDRIFPHYSKNYKDWNYPELRSNPLSLHSSPPESDGFTAVILTYDRLESLLNVIHRISETPSLSRILVIWNNPSKPPPPSSSWPKINKPLKVIQSAVNRLSNRFLPYDEIQTDCILSMDDDIPMLNSDELEFGYQIWREFPDRLVGFPSRSHLPRGNDSWKYESEWLSEISMVLTGAAFYHKHWNHVFSSPHPVASRLKAWVDEHMNCEDIAMNFLIANMTDQAPIKVTPRKKFRCATPECNNFNMISDGLSHMAERSACLNKFTEFFGYMPLKSVEFRVDPLLYKDPIPSRLQKFPEVGSL